jgi:hypothetical protein
MIKDVLTKKIEYANEHNLTEFIFAWNGDLYYVAWQKNQWSEPREIHYLGG